MGEILEDSFDVNQLKRLAGYIAPYKKKMAGVILLMLSSSALTMAIPIFFQNVMDNSIPQKDMSSIIFYSAATLLIALYSGLYAAFYYMKACYPHLKETKGSVINFASGAGLFGNYGQCAYAAAKEGIRGLTRVAANEWGPDGINANIICPLAWTAQLENFQQAYPEAFEANVKMPPAGHYGDVEKEIGRVCVQLASPDFKYMNGETLTLEGGMGLRP